MAASSARCCSSRVDEEGETDEQDEEAIEAGKAEVTSEVLATAGRVATAETDSEVAKEQLEQVEKIVERIVERPLRRRLPDTRRSITHKFNVAGHEGYLTVGLYEDGTPGELFITMAKEGSTIGGLMDSLGTAISVSLQYGVPVESLVNKFTHQRFEPAGMTHNREIPFAKSLVDYIFRWLGMEFVPGYRAANAPQRNTSKTSTSPSPSATTTTAATTTRGSAASAAVKPHDANGNGNSNGHSHSQEDHAEKTSAKAQATTATSTAPEASSRRLELAEAEEDQPAGQRAGLAAAMQEMQSDAPACDVCGTITVRNGTCYKCMNCGNSMGCS